MKTLFEKTKEMEQSLAFIKLEKIAKECDYNLISIYNKFGLNVSLQPIGKFTPDLYVRSCFPGEEGKIKMQTASYGALNEDEIEEYIKAINNGKKMLDAIKNIDMNEVYVLED